MEYSNTTKDEFGRIISESYDSSWDYGDEGENGIVSYEYDNFSRVISINEHYVVWGGDYFENRSVVRSFSYQDGYMTIEIKNNYEETDRENYSCTTSETYKKSVERKENPYHDGTTDIGHYDLLFSDYSLLNRSQNCSNNDWFSGLQYTFLENSDLVLKEFQNETINGVSTLTWRNYTYSQDDNMIMNVKNKTANEREKVKLIHAGTPPHELEDADTGV